MNNYWCILYNISRRGRNRRSNEYVIVRGGGGGSGVAIEKNYS